MKKTLTDVNERQIVQDDQHVELLHYVKRTHSLMEMMYQHMTNQSPNQLNFFCPMEIEAPNLSIQVPNLAIENGSDDIVEEEYPVKSWDHVVTALNNCEIEDYLYEYLNCKVKKAYKVFKNKTDNKI